MGQTYQLRGRRGPHYQQRDEVRAGAPVIRNRKSPYRCGAAQFRDNISKIPPL